MHLHFFNVSKILQYDFRNPFSVIFKLQIKIIFYNDMIDFILVIKKIHLSLKIRKENRYEIDRSVKAVFNFRK